MNKALQELIDLPRHWMRETHNNELPYALELQEALSHCNLTAEVPTWQELEAIHDKAWKEGGFGYDRSKAGWEAVINALVPHIPATADAYVPDRDFFAYMAGKDKGNGTYAYEDVRGAWQACEKWMQAKADELESWKRQQLEVEAQLDAQRIAKLLGTKLGESCHAAINREVPKLVEEARLWHQRYDEQTHTAAYTAQQRDEALNEVERLRAELEDLRLLLKRARGHMTNTRYNLPRIGMEEICADIDKVLSPPPDPFTTWKQRYMPNSSDDLAREAWEKAKGN